MERIIEVDILNEKDSVEKFDENKISKELIKYIINEASQPCSKIKIVLNNKCGSDLELDEMLRLGLLKEYEINTKIYFYKNLLQILLLILGILFLIISSRLSAEVVWKEVLIIVGWVPIWETVHMELFEDFKDRKKNRALKKLIKCEIEINNLNV